MKIHEHQAKALLRKFGVTVPKGDVAYTPEEARKVAEGLKTDSYVVKAQVHAGGRGKGGGIKLANSPAQVESLAKEMLGMQLVTHQTGPQGKMVNRLLIEEGVQIANELYIGIVLDRSVSQYVVMASSEGGVEIEKVAEETPEKIYKEYMNPLIGLAPFQARRLAFKLGLSGKIMQRAVKFFLALAEAFLAYDCSLAEINPLVITGTGNVLALDAKINFDDSGLYRHSDVMQMRDLSEEEPLEVKASEYHLNYIKLDGQVGCMVNGAGLAMATMDCIMLAGAMPSNFLDVGGSASVEMVRHGFEILLSDPKVKAVLINIFGGIVRCDRVAQGVVDAASQLEINVPVVVRLEGTNKEEGIKILENSPLSFRVATGFQDAATQVVSALSQA